MQVNRRLLQQQLFLTKRAIGHVLNIEHKVLCNEHERELARQAYLNLSELYNSLHRHLVSGSTTLSE